MREPSPRVVGDVAGDRVIGRTIANDSIVVAGLPEPFARRAPKAIDRAGRRCLEPRNQGSDRPTHTGPPDCAPGLERWLIPPSNAHQCMEVIWHHDPGAEHGLPADRTALPPRSRDEIADGSQRELGSADLGQEGNPYVKDDRDEIPSTSCLIMLRRPRRPPVIRSDLRHPPVSPDSHQTVAPFRRRAYPILALPLRRVTFPRPCPPAPYSIDG
jgi:hypothetical protein